MDDLAGRPGRDSIHEKLRVEILHGVLPPGTSLREVALAERFGVSRTPVRQALGRLEKEGLAERAVRGLEVAPINPQAVMQVYDTRILLEVEVSGQAALARSLGDVLRLRAQQERDEQLGDVADAVRVRSNLAFHRAVWEAADNPVLLDLLERLNSHLVHAPRSTLAVGTRWEESLIEHRRLIEAIDARDAHSAREIAREHFSTAREIRLRLLQDMVAEHAVAPLDDAEPSGRRRAPQKVTGSRA